MTKSELVDHLHLVHRDWPLPARHRLRQRSHEELRRLHQHLHLDAPNASHPHANQPRSIP